LQDQQANTDITSQWLSDVSAPQIIRSTHQEASSATLPQLPLYDFINQQSSGDAYLPIRRPSFHIEDEQSKLRFQFN